MRSFVAICLSETDKTSRGILVLCVKHVLSGQNASYICHGMIVRDLYPLNIVNRLPVADVREN